MEQDVAARLDAELELIEASLLPAESLTHHSSLSGWPVTFTITSTDSPLSILVALSETYPAPDGVHVEVKGSEDGREEAEGRKSWMEERMMSWDPNEEYVPRFQCQSPRLTCSYPLYQVLTTHFLPLLAATPTTTVTEPSNVAATPRVIDDTLHHCLLTSHHLLSPTKRKDLIALSSQLSLVGFAKTGHPGIMYAIGTRDDLEEWLREVKSWNWLALRVRVAPEVVPSDFTEDGGAGRGGESGARGGKGRGEWTQLDKLSDALEWMRHRGRERMLLDVGMGSSKG